MKKRKIEIAVIHKKQLALEYGVSIQTIHLTLRGVFNSERSARIRQRAKELLQQEIDNIILHETE